MWIRIRESGRIFKSWRIEIENVNRTLIDFLFDINSGYLTAETAEIDILNSLFNKLNKVGSSKAKKYGLMYNKPKVILTKKGKKRIIKIMVMDGGAQTTTKPAPSKNSITNTPKEVTTDTRILLRRPETVSIGSKGTGATANVTSSRKEIAYNSLREAAIWMDEIQVPLSQCQN